FFVVWQIGCAFAPNIGALIAFRFLSGIGGVGCVTLGGRVVADLFPVQQRGLATSIWSMGPLFGPLVGPICGEFTGESIGWRWVYRTLAILGDVLSLGVQLFNRETYPPVLIQRKTVRMAKELGLGNLRSAYGLAKDENRSAVQILRQGLRRPVVLLFISPIIFLLATYMAFAYGLLFLFLTAITPVFRNQYGFSSGISGLAYLGIGIGSFISLYIAAITNDRIVIKLAARNGDKVEQEMRLPTMVIFSCLLPITFFWYGWSADNKVHWIVPII
ncbi:major facilitator superfamily transporter, partial [Fusarium tjaetaba]